MDMWQYIRREFKFDMSKREYQLQSLSRRFIGDGKEGVDFKEITPLFHDGPGGRAKLAMYCLKVCEPNSCATRMEIKVPLRAPTG